MSLPRAAYTVTAVLRRELAGYFGSPVAYVFIIIFLLLNAFFTFSVSRFFEAGQADLRAFFQWHPWLYLFLIPAVAMRLWAEERRLGTIELVLTLPLTALEVILGKFLAAWAFVGIALALTFPMVLTVLFLGDPDLGVIACAYAGSLLMAGAYLAVGSMTSALTRSQVVSFILAVVICLFLILAGFPPVTEALGGWLPAWLAQGVSRLSFLTRFLSIERGVLDLRDLVYWLSVMLFMLLLNAAVIHNRQGA